MFNDKLLLTVVTLIIAFASGFLLYKVKFPGGFMIGSILGVAMFNIATSSATIGPNIKFVSQLIAGVFIGSGVRKKDLKRLKMILKPLSLIVLNLLLLNLVLGYLIIKTTSVDPITAFMSVIPGGMSDTPLIAADLGANSAVVATLQFVRMLFGIGVMPYFIKRMYNYNDNNQETIKNNHFDFVSVKGTNPYYNTILLIVTVFISGLLGKFLKIPAGVLLFSMISTILLKLVLSIESLPRSIKRIAQIFAGAYIGSKFVYDDLLILRGLWLPVILILIFYFVNCLITGELLHRLFKFDKKVALLAATPAGASDMALISSDIGVNSIDLVIIQVFRMILVISIFPQIIVIVVNTFF